MPSATFELSFPYGRETITQPGTGLHVRVYRLDLEELVTSIDQVTIYGDDHGRPIAFVTDLDEANLLNFTSAIMWYARYLDHPDMQPSMIDPRIARRRELVN